RGGCGADHHCGRLSAASRRWAGHHHGRSVGRDLWAADRLRHVEGGIYGLLIAFGMLYGDREIFMFPLPFMIKAKYMVAVMIFLVIIATFEPSQGGVANFAHLGGLFFGFIYIKFLPRRGLVFSLSEWYYSVRNEYYRAKRRRAAKKFQVYMKKHGENPGTFDEYGNYQPPDDKKNGEGKSGWVN